MQEDKPIEKKELTEEEIKAEAIVNRYLEPIESEKQSTIDKSLNSETEIGSNNSDINLNSSSTILSNKIASKNVTNTSQPINSRLPTAEVNQTSINNPNISTNSQNLDNLNQFQLIDLIASTISNANNIDKNKVIQSINDLIEPTNSNGGNVIELLKKITEGILKDPSGSIANNIINIAKQNKINLNLSNICTYTNYEYITNLTI